MVLSEAPSIPVSGYWGSQDRTMSKRLSPRPPADLP
jgi:hypothetical protein